MPRSNRPKRSKNNTEPEELALDRVRSGIKRTENKNGLSFVVQASTGRNAEGDKSWVCPFCNHSISVGLSHLVVWDEERGLDTRRHFHSGCWPKFQGKLF